MTSLRWPFLISATSSVGHDHLVDEVLHVQRGDPVLEVGLHPVLHAGVGVHDEPVALLLAQGGAELLQRVRGGRLDRLVGGLVGSAASSAARRRSASSAPRRSRRRRAPRRRSSAAASVGSDGSLRSSMSSESSTDSPRRARHGLAGLRVGEDLVGPGRLVDRLVSRLVDRLLVVLLRHDYSVISSCCKAVVAAPSLGHPAGAASRSPKSANTALPKARSSSDT